jgi:transcriptional regulator with XRE-family HTH domain
MGFPEKKTQTIETIGDRIRIRAKELKSSSKISQLDIAKKINKASSDISRWKRNEPPIPAEMIELLADAMQCDPAWLLTGTSAEREAQSSAQLYEKSKDRLSPNAEEDSFMTWKFNVVEAIYTAGNDEQKKRLNKLLGEIMNEMLTQDTEDPSLK